MINSHQLQQYYLEHIRLIESPKLFRRRWGGSSWIT